MMLKCRRSLYILARQRYSSSTSRRDTHSEGVVAQSRLDEPVPLMDSDSKVDVKPTAIIDKDPFEFEFVKKIDKNAVLNYIKIKEMIDQCAGVEHNYTIYNHIMVPQTYWVPMFLGYNIASRTRKLAAEIKHNTNRSCRSSIDINVDFDNVIDGEVAVFVRGTDEACRYAEKMILRLRDTLPDTTILGPEAQYDLLLDERGSKKWWVRNIGTGTGTRVFVNKRAAKEGICPMVISGKPEDCVKARKAIKQFLDLQKLSDNFSNSSNSKSNSVPDIRSQTETILWIPVDQAFGNLKQYALKQVREQSKCQIEIGHALTPEGLVPVRIMGVHHETAHTRDRIITVVDEHRTGCNMARTVKGDWFTSLSYANPWKPIFKLT